MEEIPYEVKFARMHLSMGAYNSIYEGYHFVGMDTFIKINKTIEDYPEYFPWHTLYNSIPKEVHDAFEQEAFPDEYIKRVIPFKLLDENDLISSAIEDTKVETITVKSTITKEEFEKFLIDCKESSDREYKEKREKDKKLRVLWEKHYGKYKLEYGGIY